MARITRNSIEKSLKEELKKLDKTSNFYMDLVADYMKLWDLKEQLFADIERRGVVYKDKSSTGVEMQKNNPSTKEVLMVNRQMLQIIKEIGFSEVDLERFGYDDL